MARSFRSSKVYNAPVSYFADMTRAIGGAGYNFKVTSENPTPTGVWFRIIHGMSAMSYGEKITVTITANGPQTNVEVFSECGMPTQLVDGGKNASNVNLIFKYFESNLTSATAAAPVQQPAQPAPVQQAPQAVYSAPVQPVSRPKFCTKCGNRLGESDRFCTVCGNRIG